MYARSVVFKLVVFVIGFTLLFWAVKISGVLPQAGLIADLKSIPVLFGAGNFLFSIISGFVIQAQWSKWDTLMDATRGEVSTLRQLFIVAHHFPVKERNDIRFYIYKYLDIYCTTASKAKGKDLIYRSRKVDEAMVRIEDTMFVLAKRYPDIGNQAFTYLTRAMEYREIKLQSGIHRLPLPIRVFLLFATGSVIIGSLFMPFSNLMYNYYFTVVVASLAFGIIMIVDDFDNPYRPGIYYLSVDAHKELRNEIRSKLEYYAFDFAKAEAKENTRGFDK
jgi:hypothetical protein